MLCWLSRLSRLWGHGLFCSVVELAWLNGLGGYMGRCNWCRDKLEACAAPQDFPWLRVCCVCWVVYHWRKDRIDSTQFISMIYIAVLFLSNRVMRIARCYSARSRTSFLHLCPPRWRQEVQRIFSDEFEAFFNIIFIRPHRASQDTLLIPMYGKNARVPAAFLQNSS